MTCKSGVSVSYSLLAYLYTYPAGFESQTFSVLICLLQDPQVGESDVGLDPLGRTCAIVIILPFVGHLPGHVGPDYTRPHPS